MDLTDIEQKLATGYEISFDDYWSDVPKLIEEIKRLRAFLPERLHLEPNAKPEPDACEGVLTYAEMWARYGNGPWFAYRAKVDVGFVGFPEMIRQPITLADIGNAFLALPHHLIQSIIVHLHDTSDIPGPVLEQFAEYLPDITARQCRRLERAGDPI